MLITKNIIVQKQIRFFQSKEIKENDEIWILFHGYGQNPIEFYDAFKNFEENNRCFILLEGPSKFYKKGMNGEVGTSWMTSENRDMEIINLNNMINSIIGSIEVNKVNIFAFSQGVATACRWINKSSLVLGEIILWGSHIPLELTNPIIELKPQMFFGKLDPFIKEHFVKEIPESMITWYNGKHNFNELLLRKYVFKKYL